MTSQLTSLWSLCVSLNLIDSSKQIPPTPEEMGHCDSVYLSEVGDTQVVVFKHGKKNLTLFLLAIHNVCVCVCMYVCIYLYLF